jgi:multidrug efflux pump subunit AcrA (membrane-fusion protein)
MTQKMNARSVANFCLFISFCWVLCTLASCNNKIQQAEEKGEENLATAAVVPVTVVSVSHDPIVEYVELNATSSYLLKYYAKSNITGYIQTVYVKPGVYIRRGQPLFLLKTKESRSLDSTVSKLSADFKFSGENTIKSTDNGYVVLLNHQEGDYVQEGEQLATISDENSLVFLLAVPYEWKRFAKNGSSVKLELPDGTSITGTVTDGLSTIDANTQIENKVVRIAPQMHIPENLVATVKLEKNRKNHVQTLPKAAVLTNDIQSEFWVMKLSDSNTAVKVPITKGITADNRIEIVSPQFSAGDKILVSGNFGLGDTAKVAVSH